MGWHYAIIIDIDACPQTGEQTTWHSKGKKRPASVQCNGGPHLYHLTVQFLDGSLMEINVSTTGEASLFSFPPQPVRPYVPSVLTGR